MKKLLTLTALLFSLTMMFASPSYAEWTKVGEDVDGNTYYADFARIRKVSGYVYYWTLMDNLKPTKWGDLSSKNYLQGDCKLFRYKWLSFSYYKEPMGGGTGDVSEPVAKNKGWKYPPPDSSIETVLNKVCKVAN